MKRLLIFLFFLSNSVYSQISAEEYFDRGLQNKKNNLNNMAINSFTQAIKIDPNYVDAYYFRGSAKVAIGDDEGALEDFTKVINLNPADSIKLASAYGMRGEVRFILDDDEGACDDFKKASELGDERSKELMANICDKKEEKVETTTYSQTAGEYYQSGKKKYENEDYEGAIADWTKAIEIDPNNSSSSYNGLGVAKLLVEDYEGAIADFTKAIELNPDDA